MEVRVTFDVWFDGFDEITVEDVTRAVTTMLEDGSRANCIELSNTEIHVIQTEK